MVWFGTRIKDSLRYDRQDQGTHTNFQWGDPGMSKKVGPGVAITFTTGTNQISAANGTFAAFAVQDEILVQGTNFNNGYYTVTAIDAANHAFLTVDPGLVTEGPISTAFIRTR
jgi:hypothetical protein